MDNGYKPRGGSLPSHFSNSITKGYMWENFTILSSSLTERESRGTSRTGSSGTGSSVTGSPLSSCNSPSSGSLSCAKLACKRLQQVESTKGWMITYKNLGSHIAASLHEVWCARQFDALAGINSTEKV